MKRVDMPACKIALSGLTEGDKRFEELRRYIIRNKNYSSRKALNVIVMLVENGWAVKLGERGSGAPYHITAKGKMLLSAS